jgi:hypothetical protein
VKTIVVSALVLTAMTSAALAGAPAKVAPMQLTDAQLDNVSAAGRLNIFLPIQGLGGNASGGACQVCVGNVARGGDGVSFRFRFEDD